MEIDEALYAAFLDELRGLEDFRVAHAKDSEPLRGSDPDVQRIMEALALYSARTRLVARRGVERGMLRLFREYFHELACPTPAAAVLIAKGELRDGFELPPGTALRIPMRPNEAPAMGMAGLFAKAPVVAGEARFRMVAGLTLRPLVIHAVESRLVGREGERWIRLELRAPGGLPLSWPSGTLELFVDQLGDAAASLLLHHELRTHFKKAELWFDQDPPREVPCRFGRPVSGLDTPGLDGALFRARSVLRYPEQTAFLSLGLPRPPEPRRSMFVQLSFGPTWSLQLRPNVETFVLHAVPALNLERADAALVVADGSRRRWPVLASDSEAGLVLHSELGAYQREGNRETPLWPGALEGEDRSYELDYEGAGAERKGWLRLQGLDDMVEPASVRLDAWWHQPGWWSNEFSAGSAYLHDHHVPGVEWEVFGLPKQGADAPFERSPERMFALLGMRSQRFLDQAELLVLLEALGAGREPGFAAVVAGLKSVANRREPFQVGQAGFRYIYTLNFERLDPALAPRLYLLGRVLHEVLHAWSTEEVVRLELETKGGQRFVFPEGTR